MSADAYGTADTTGRLSHLLSAVWQRDPGHFEDGFDGLSAPARDALGNLLLKLLERRDLPGWGWACNRIPWGYLDAGRTELAARTNRRIAEREAEARAAAPDVRRKQLARTAFMLLRIGTAAVPLLTRLHDDNERLPRPLAAAEVDKLAIWCADRHARSADGR